MNQKLTILILFRQDEGLDRPQKIAVGYIQIYVNLGEGCYTMIWAAEPNDAILHGYAVLK
jgi:hypothetical protein